MADKKISALTAASTPLAGTEVLPIVQSNATVKVSVANLTAGRAVATGNLTTTGTTSFTVNTADTAGMTGTNSSNSAYFTLQVGGSNGYGVANWANSTVLESVPASTGGLVLGSYSGKTYFQIARTTYADLSSTALTFTSINLVQGTAAKGINFTANTGAAGMTSQLLNWYEEGTWTPDQGAGLTVVGAFSSSGTYTRVGRLVLVNGTVSGATSVAIAAAATQICTNLPFSCTNGHSGTMFNAAINATGGIAASAGIVYAVSTMAATTSITFTIAYRT